MHGRDIDAHQEVIRLGQGPTGGRFLEDVGSRTTLRITNAYLFVPSHNNLSMFGTTLQSEGWPRLPCLNRHCPVQKEGWSRLFTCIRLPRCADHLVGRFKPTTGFSTALLLLDDTITQLPPWMPRCDRLHLYGFDDTDPSAPYHYWSDGKNPNTNSTEFYRKSRQTSTHDFKLEHIILRAKLGGTRSLDGPFVIRRAAVAAMCARKA